MLRRLIVILVLALAPAIAGANAFERSIVSQLRAQGYSNIEISRTFLGRGRITAQSRDLNREIIFNPATGAILRDYARQRDRVQLFDPGGEAAGGGTIFGGDDRDEDGDADGDNDSDGDGDSESDGDSDSDSDGGEGGESDGGEGGDGDGGGDD